MKKSTILRTVPVGAMRGIIEVGGFCKRRSEEEKDKKSTDWEHVV